MSKRIRVLPLLLALAMILACFAGCKSKDGDGDASQKTASVTSQKPTDVIENTNTNDLPENVDLGGVVLKVAAGDESVLFPDPEASTLDERRKAWIDDCKKKYNFDLEFVYYEDGKMTETLMPDLLTGEYVCDFVLPWIRQAGPFIQAGLCANLLAKDFEYLDFSKPWWDTTMVRASRINGKVYACTPQFTSAADMTWVMYFNKTVLKDIGYDSKYIYDLQASGKWTFDEMFKLAKLAVKDLNDDGKMVREDDRFGLVSPTWHISQCWMTTTGAEYIREENNSLKFCLNNANAIRAMTKMNEMLSNSMFHAGLENTMHQLFCADRALFMAYSVKDCRSEALRNMNSDFGMVLMPKYQAEMDYISRAQQNTYCCFVPAGCPNKAAVGLALQALSYNAWKIGVPDIMELNYAQYVKDDESEFCVNEVFNHTTFTVDQLLYDVGAGDQTWYKIIDTYLSKPLLIPNMDVSGAIRSVEGMCQSLLDEFYAQATK